MVAVEVKWIAADAAHGPRVIRAVPAAARAVIVRGGRVEACALVVGIAVALWLRFRGRFRGFVATALIGGLPALLRALSRERLGCLVACACRVIVKCCG